MGQLLKLLVLITLERCAIYLNKTRKIRINLCCFKNVFVLNRDLWTDYTMLLRWKIRFEWNDWKQRKEVSKRKIGSLFVERLIDFWTSYFCLLWLDCKMLVMCWFIYLTIFLFSFCRRNKFFCTAKRGFLRHNKEIGQLDRPLFFTLSLTIEQSFLTNLLPFLTVNVHVVSK